ncbi:MAG: response regulator [Planctomycetota bacterium]|nr:MAG: response regulator [Planctomycetota bacterium]
MKILVVEDNFINRNLLVSMLSRYGTCDVAVNGEEAVAAFKEYISEPYDLICLDINMPVKNGQEALKEMRAYEHETNNTSGASKIIMTTSLDDSKNILEAFKEQCDGYLVKPIHLDKVKELLTSLKLI